MTATRREKAVLETLAWEAQGRMNAWILDKHSREKHAQWATAERMLFLAVAITLFQGIEGDEASAFAISLAEDPCLARGIKETI